MKNKYLTENERYQIEILLKDGKRPSEIAILLGRCVATIYNEIKRGKVTLRNSDYTERTVYCADVAQRKAEGNSRNKGIDLKISNDYEFVEYVEHMIIQKKYSPYAIIQDIKRKKLNFRTKVCEKTLYNYIHQGIFLNVTMENLPYSKYRKKKPNKKISRPSHNRTKGNSIDLRPDFIHERNSFGHWEIDTVYSKQQKRKTLLVLTERMTRQEYIMPLKSRTQIEVKKALDKLEKTLSPRKFRETFLSITADNGSEFNNPDIIIKSCINKMFPRTNLYYCHPYSSWERGSNENQNKLIRRWIPKGSDISDFSDEYIYNLQNWMNDYPRRIFDGLSSNDMLPV